MDISFHIKSMFVGVSLTDFIDAYRMRNINKMKNVYKRLAKTMEYDMMNFTLLVFLFFEKKELEKQWWSYKRKDYKIFDWLISHVYMDFYATKAYLYFDGDTCDTHINAKLNEMTNGNVANISAYVEGTMDADTEESLGLVKLLLKWCVTVIHLYKYSIQFTAFTIRLLVGSRNMSELMKEYNLPKISMLIDITNRNGFNTEDRKNALLIVETVNKFME